MFLPHSSKPWVTWNFENGSVWKLLNACLLFESNSGGSVSRMPKRAAGQVFLPGRLVGAASGHRETSEP